MFSFCRISGSLELHQLALYHNFTPPSLPLQSPFHSPNPPVNIAVNVRADAADEQLPPPPLLLAPSWCSWGWLRGEAGSKPQLWITALMIIVFSSWLSAPPACWGCCKSRTVLRLCRHFCFWRADEVGIWCGNFSSLLFFISPHNKMLLFCLQKLAESEMFRRFRTSLKRWFWNKLEQRQGKKET